MRKYLSYCAHKHLLHELMKAHENFSLCSMTVAGNKNWRVELLVVRSGTKHSVCHVNIEEYEKALRTLTRCLSPPKSQFKKKICMC